MDKLTDERLEELKVDIGVEDYTVFRDLWSALTELQTMRQKLKDGLLVELPFIPKNGKKLIDINEHIEEHPYPDYYDIDGSSITLVPNGGDSYRYMLDDFEYDFAAFGTIVFEEQEDAWRALKAETIKRAKTTTPAKTQKGLLKWKHRLSYLKN